MKFAVFKYYNSIDDLHINKFVKKMPKPMVDFYIQRKNPYYCKEIDVMGVKGFEVTLPFNSGNVIEDYGKTTALLERTVEDLYINDVGIAVTKQDMPFVKTVRLSQGKAMLSFYIDDIMKYVLDKKEIDIKKAEILVVDGGNFITDLVVDSIYESVNYLTVLTDNGKKFEEKEEQILSETGLNIKVIHSGKNTALKTADVIINCAMDLENTDYFFKKGAVYIDTIKNSAKLKRLITRREDMILADGAGFMTSDGIVAGDILEAAMFVSEPDFKKFLLREYNSGLGKNIKEGFEKKDIKVAGISLMGKTIKL